MASPLKKLIYPAAKQIYNLPGVRPVVAPAWQSFYHFYHGLPASDAEKAKMEAYAPPLPDDPRYFIITSCGHNGSLWLGKMLHQHPDIMCATGYDPPPVSLDYGDNKDECAIINSVYKTAADFKYGSTKFSGLKSVYGDMPARTPKQYRFLLEEMEALPKFKNQKIIGSIHSVHAYEVWDVAKEGPNAMGGRFKHTTFLDLIRHPVNRLDTVIHHIALRIQPEGDELAPYADLMRKFEREQGADFSDPLQRAYIQAEYVQKSSFGWVEDATVLPQYPRIIFERLRNSPDYFGWLVSYLTGGKVTAGKDYLDRIYAPENMAAGRITGRKKRVETPREAYGEWPRWIQADFAKTCDELGLRERYRPYGYDLSFVK